MKEMQALQMRFDLPPSLARIVMLLVENEVVTPRMIEVDHKITKDAKVAMHRLRRRLDTVAEIKSRRDVGYWLEPEARFVLRDGMKPMQLELPFDGGAMDEALPQPSSR